MREETFELAVAARDRFLMEITLDTPAGEAEREALVFEPRVHDTDALIGTLPSGLVQHRELGALSAAIEGHIQASSVLRRYALALWRASEHPGEQGVRLAQEGLEEVAPSLASGLRYARLETASQWQALLRPQLMLAALALLVTRHLRPVRRFALRWPWGGASRRWR